MMKLLSLPLVAFGLTFSVLYMLSPHKRVNRDDGMQTDAWHVFLPGYVTVGAPAQEVDLRRWVGTTLGSLEAVDKNTGEQNPQVTAGLALVVSGIFSGYEIQQRGDHYVLHKGAWTDERFTMKAPYRVGPWQRRGEQG